MHPNQVNKELLAIYGTPKVLSILGVPIVNFPLGKQRGTLVKRFGFADCLQKADAISLFKANQNSLAPEILDEIGALEGLPKEVHLVPEVSTKLSTSQRAGRLAELSWDEQFYETCRFVLHCMRDSGPSASVYPLIEGAPGASKTQVAMAIAALSQRPTYVVVGGDGAADEIKAALLGGPYPSDKAPWAIAKENSYIGALTSPRAEYKLIQLLSQKPFEAITIEEFKSIADLEGIREGITYDKKGAYQLAKDNGGILLLEECNSYPAEVHSILTQILENYVHGETHPNFFVIATQNPAGDSHPSRNALPKEVVNRFERITVQPPDLKQYEQALTFALFKEQPTILVNGQKKKVTPAMLGIDLTPMPPHPLVRLLAPTSLQRFISAYAKFHKQIEEKIADGILNPQESQEPATKETAFVSRRNIRRFLNGLESEILSLNDQTEEEFGAVDLHTYLQGQGKPKVTSSQIVNAIWQTLYRYYIIPNTFPMFQKVEVANSSGAKKNTTIHSSKTILLSLAADCHLDVNSMSSYITTVMHDAEVSAEFSKQISKAAGIFKCKKSKEAQLREVFKQLTPAQQQSCSFLADNGEITLAFLYEEDPFSSIDEVCPHLKSEGTQISVIDNIIKDLDKRRKSLEKQGLRYLAVNELTAVKDWVQQFRTEKQLYLFPTTTTASAGTEVFGLAGSIHRDLFISLGSNGEPITPADPKKKANLDELLKMFSNAKPFANVLMPLLPRDAKGALSSPPLAHIKKGVKMGHEEVTVILGDGVKPSIGLIELVKCI